MATTTYALHQIADAESFAFTPDDYSLFKFGDDEVAQAFGEALAEGFIKRHLPAIEKDQQLVVVSSPYSFIPTATFALKNYFVYSLNRWLSQRGRPVVQETKVHRTITYKDDYGELDAAERMRLIGNDSFHIDKAFLAGKTVIFLDDIRITGSHERMIMKMVDEFGINNKIYLLYFAELVNKDIHPNIENYLNYYAVKSIFDLQPIVQGKRFAINTRIVKYILNYEFEPFMVFLQLQNEDFQNQLYDMALGNGYHEIDAYARNLKFIRETILNHKLQQVNHGN